MKLIDNWNVVALLLGVSLLAGAMMPAAAATPEVGAKAPDFVLKSVSGKPVRLSEEYTKAKIVLVVLRGFPGYQCPLCNRQVKDFLQNAAAFAETGAKVLMVYPGPPEGLNDRANEFSADKVFPPGFELLLDPGYEFTNAYGLRWDAPKETAYPSTFLIDSKGMVTYSIISKSHGGRSTAKDILERLQNSR